MLDRKFWSSYLFLVGFNLALMILSARAFQEAFSQELSWSFAIIPGITTFVVILFHLMNTRVDIPSAEHPKKIAIKSILYMTATDAVVLTLAVLAFLFIMFTL